MNPGNIGVVTVGRSDYGIYAPILKRLTADNAFKLQLFVGGMHLSPDHGMTVEAIEDDGYPIAARVEMLGPSDTPDAIVAAMGMGVAGFGAAFHRLRPDLLIVLGDRFEMAAACIAALPLTIPVAHIHGGERTEGAYDEAFRHAMTKMSHLHFVATGEYGDRVIQLGEAPWRVTVCGAPALDQVATVSRIPASDLRARFNITTDPPPLLVTFHSTTLEYDRAAHQTDELLGAVDASGLPAVFTLPNADTNGGIIGQRIRAFAADRPACQFVDNLGTRAYFSLMTIAAAMVGNSSSGIVEAASFRLPVVNIGRRQQGRLTPANVISTGTSRHEILGAIRRATAPGFRRDLGDLVNPYGDGHATEQILQVLRDTTIDDRLLIKRFHDIPVNPARPLSTSDQALDQALDHGDQNS